MLTQGLVLGQPSDLALGLHQNLTVVGLLDLLAVQFGDLVMGVVGEVGVHLDT